MLNQFVIIGIQKYQATISPILKREGYTCLFTPSCSTYALEAFKKHNFVIALSLTLFRLLSCNPLNAYYKRRRMGVMNYGKGI